MLIYSLLLSLLVSASNADSNDRIKYLNIDRDEVRRINISFGKAQIIRFPEAIEEVRIGLPNFYFSEISSKYKKELEIKLTSDVQYPTNVIVRTASADIYVFDVVPSKINNDDVVFIDSSYRKIESDSRSYPRRTILIKGNKKLIFNNKGHL